MLLPTSAFPLDLERTGYSYIERHNATLLALLHKHVLHTRPNALVLDVGCGAGANGRAIRQQHTAVQLHGIEPNARAAELAGEVYDRVFSGTSDRWLAEAPQVKYDAAIFSDVLEHLPDPVAFLRSLAGASCLAGATWVISVPNYAVWYNRLRTLAGRFDYSWSGLYDRTHLRFFTKQSLHELLEYVGLRVIDDGSTPSLVQSLAPVLRKLFQEDVQAGQHLTLPQSKAFRVYETAVEPLEARFCQLWPELLAFQHVVVAKLDRP